MAYTITVANAGPSTAHGVTVVDPLPAGVTAGALPAGCSGTTTITCTLANIAAGGSTPIVVPVNVGPATRGSLSNTATVSTTDLDPVPGNNSATATTTVATQADVSITKSDAPDPVVAGMPLSYTLHVANAGPSTATGIVVTDPATRGLRRERRRAPARLRVRRRAPSRARSPTSGRVPLPTS